LNGIFLFVFIGYDLESFSSNANKGKYHFD
jgi:hypothetical protein